MFRVLATLCLLAASAFGIMEKGVKVTFGLNPLKFGSSLFAPLPETKDEATSSEWVTKPIGPVPAGYEKLTLMCLPTDNTLCLFYDENGNIMGYQIALDPNRFSNETFDWSTSGFKDWTVDENGETITFHTTFVFFASPEYLAKDAEIRDSERDETMILQDSTMYVTGFNGDLVSVPTNTTQLHSEGVFTKQGCMLGMGLHYYYKMTKTLSCSEDTVLTYFILVHDEQIVGIGFMLPGQYSITAGHKDRFERPSNSVVKIIVPYGPDCLGEYADTNGLITMHMYFVNHPYFITCPLF